MATATERRWPLAEALPIAQRIKERLAPACERIEIAGSIRRRKANVGDVELLVIPRITTYQADMLGMTKEYDHLDAWIKLLINAEVLGYRPTAKALRTYGPRNKLLVDTATGMAVDVFSTAAANWGMAFVVRTGPAEFNIKVMSRLRALGLQGHAYGGITQPGPKGHEGSQRHEINCPDEETVFHYLQWKYIPPENRQ